MTIVNLRREKKRRARDAKRKAATARAEQHGQSGTERCRQTAEAERKRRLLDGHRLDGHPPGDDET